jgi:catechol 2,3-dioxygenase-like lactoylglutathione lyase family enzyme
MAEDRKSRLVGINHVAIEVDDIDQALDWYGKIFDFTLRGRSERNAFIDMGDQFVNLTSGSPPRPGGAERRISNRRGPDRRAERRHIGFVVDDRSSVKARAEAAGARMVDGPFLDFLDPWGNRIEVIEYSNIQFTKAPHVLRGMGLALGKNEKAETELAEKGMAPDA